MKRVVCCFKVIQCHDIFLCQQNQQFQAMCHELKAVWIIEVESNWMDAQALAANGDFVKHSNRLHVTSVGIHNFCWWAGLFCLFSEWRQWQKGRSAVSKVLQALFRSLLILCVAWLCWRTLQMHREQIKHTLCCQVSFNTYRLDLFLEKLIERSESCRVTISPKQNWII